MATVRAFLEFSENLSSLVIKVLKGFPGWPATIRWRAGLELHPCWFGCVAICPARENSRTPCNRQLFLSFPARMDYGHNAPW